MHLSREEKIPNAFVVIQGIINYVETETFARRNLNKQTYCEGNAVTMAKNSLTFTQMLLTHNLLRDNLGMSAFC